MRRPDPRAADQFHSVRVEKTRAASDKLEIPRLKLLHAMVRELACDPPFPRMHGAHVGCGPGDAQAEIPSGAGEVEHLRRIDQGLRRHASAQDAKATEPPGAVYDGDALPERGGDARSVVARRSAAYD